MNNGILEYNASQTDEDSKICNALAKLIEQHLVGSEREAGTVARVVSYKINTYFC